MTVDTKDLAMRLLDALDGPSLATDAGVISVLYHIAAYPCQTIVDMAAATGFSESQIENYIGALSPFLTPLSAGWELNRMGEDALEGRVSPLGARASSSLTPAQLVRWEEIKNLIMDTPRLSLCSLREQMERYFDVLDGKKTPTMDERIEIQCDFMNQGGNGIVIHRPGAVPLYDFKNLKSHFDLEASDEEITRAALSAGLTFW